MINGNFVKHKFGVWQIDFWYKDPCTNESQKSMQCLSDNNYDKSACETHFENYRECKKFWGQVTL
jgi:hypothetical protein